MAARKKPTTARGSSRSGTKQPSAANSSAAIKKTLDHFDTPKPAEFSKDEELHAYRDMLLIRRFEEKAGQLYGMGLIGGFCHLYIGQEAVVVGMQMALRGGRPGHHRLPRPRPHARHRHGPARA